MRDQLERHFGVAMAQLPGDVGEAGAEQERVDVVAVVRDRVQEVQQDLRVAAHAAADVAQHDQRRRLFDLAGGGDVENLAVL